jgi:hypothetical protein
VPVQFDDLAQVDQALHAGLQQMLTFDGDVADVYERTFEAEFAVYGAPVTAPLVPGGLAHARPGAHCVPKPAHERQSDEGIGSPHAIAEALLHDPQHTPSAPPVHVVPGAQPAVP